MRFLVFSLVTCLAYGANDGLLPIPGNLKSDGVPAVSREVFQDTQRYTDSRQAALLDWNPLRREILIATRFGNVPQIHHVAMPGGARRQLTFFTERVTEAAFNPKNPDETVFSKDTGGDEFYQYYLLNRRHTRVTRITQQESQPGIPVCRDGGIRQEVFAELIQMSLFVLSLSIAVAISEITAQPKMKRAIGHAE